MKDNFLKPFIEAVDAAGLEVLGIEIYKDDDLRFRYRWQEDVPVNIWSHTKDFTSAAVGLAIADGKLSLTDRVVDVLPEFAGVNPDTRLQQITLKHVLMMSSGQKSNLLFGPLRDDPEKQIAEFPKDAKGNPVDLMERILMEPFVEDPGLSFSYSNSDANLAARMVEASVGLSIASYVYHRLFKPMGIPRPYWEADLKGHTYGDAGLHLKTTDMVKLGRLYCKNGEWNGVQIVDPAWIKESTTKQIDTPVRDPWDCGYGYLIWKFPYDDGFRFAGIGGQNSIVLPNKNIVIGINAKVGKRLGELKAILTNTVILPLMESS